MKTPERFTFTARLRSFYYAWSGIRKLFWAEHNMRIHLACAVVAIIVGAALKISIHDWIIITGCIAGVFIAEAFNTAIEKLCNVVHPERHPGIGSVKDISAAAVLIAAVAAFITGMLVFLPYLAAIFR
ncbi:diacylglycerol kinase family protein [Pedobacter sp. SYP-B3415]|uniref:diacylglycerol kinase family protein n=1 Tax=Pedobacter sp. SYP-B3415 TaxID=2496641 RepID=UPI00101BFFC3|nr:diacylglycerol kinase family protein [Pedobacter sp. SYP-B3415]